MSSIMSTDIAHAIKILQQGGIIAYPTEGVYGIGCDPYNEQAVMRLLSLKQRSVAQGLILVAATWSQVAKLCQPLAVTTLQIAQQTWPGPVTWLFPASDIAPYWITGNHATIAIRISAHPLILKLCTTYQQAIVSTSANITGYQAAKSATEVYQIFQDQIDYVMVGELGNLSGPTEIRDILTGHIIRHGK